jgi:hypothetical protein
MAEQVLISVYVPQSIAVRGGKSEYGELPYAPTDEDLASLTEPERVFLFDRYISGRSTDSLRLDAPTPQWATIVRCLRETMRRDPSVHRRNAEDTQRTEAEQEALGVARAQAKAAIDQWATRLGGAYALGIAQGFSMETRLVEYVHTRLKEELVRRGIQEDQIRTLRQNTRQWSRTKLSVQRAPDQRAFDTFKLVNGCRGALDRLGDLPECISYATRIMRCEIAEDDVKLRFTAVVVGVSCLCWRDSMVVINTERGRDDDVQGGQPR